MAHMVMFIDVKIFLALGNALFSKRYLLVFFFYFVITLFERSHKSVGFLIQICRFFSSARNDERCSRFVDQYGVDLVDDGEVQFSLHHLLDLDDHIVPQIVEAVFVVRTVCDISSVSRLPFLFAYTMNDAADSKTQERVALSHPLRVTLCEVIVTVTTCTPLPSSAFR